MDSVGSLDEVVSQIEADQQVHNPLEVLEPFMNGPETLPLDQVNRIWRVAVTQSARTAVRGALGDSVCAGWQDAWGQFEARLREQLARVTADGAAAHTFENLLNATRAAEAMPLFLESVRALETSLLRLRTVLAFNWSDTDNAYRRQENQLSGMISEPVSDPERRRSLAAQINAANARYQGIYVPKLEDLRSEVTQSWTRCEALSPFFPASDWPEVEQWFSLARKAVPSRLAGIGMARVCLEMDVILSGEVAAGNLRIETVDGKSSEVLSEEATARMKGCAERVQEFVQAIQEEDDGPRRNLAATLLGETRDATEKTKPTTTEALPSTQQRYHPIQRSAWFRLGQIAWWGGLAFWMIVLSLATQDPQSWIIGAVIGVGLFFGIKAAVFFVVLGRTTLHERPGTGFIDLDEFRQEMLTRGSLDDAMSAGFEELRKRYGRRIPAAILRGWAEHHLSDAQGKKREIIADADRRGTTINVDSLRRTFLARPEKSDEYLAHCDQVLLRLQVEHGPEIPVSVVSEMADSAETA